MDAIPAVLADRLAAWLAEGRTGTITLGVNQGHIKDYEIREFGKVATPSLVDSDKKVCLTLRRTE